MGTVVADQIVSSMANVFVVFALARAVSAAEFGAFSLGYFVYLACLGLARAVNGEVFIVHAAEKPSRETRALAVGAAATLGVAFGAVLIGLRAFVEPPAGDVLLIFGIAMPALLIQDVYRQIALVCDRPVVALVSDSSWLVVGVGGIVIAAEAAELSLIEATAIWASAGAISLCPFAVARLSGISMRPLHWAKTKRATRAKLAADFSMSMGVRQLAMVGLGAFVGLAALGSIRAGQSIFGAIAILQYALIQAGTISASRRAAEGMELHVGALALVSALLCGMALVLTVALMLIPEGAGEFLLGDTWAGTRAIVLPLGLWTAALFITTGAEIALRSARRFSTLLVLRATVGVVYLAVLWFGARAFGLSEALYLGAASFVVLSIPWWYFAVVRQGDPEEVVHGDTSAAGL